MVQNAGEILKNRLTWKPVKRKNTAKYMQNGHSLR